MVNEILNNNKLKKKKIVIDKNDLGENFVAPDGGWGWVVCLACGLSNLCICPTFQNFGIIFRNKLANIGLTNSEITSIFNTHQAVSSCTGLLNGPMFRYFSYRQMAFTAGILIGSGLFLSSFADSFHSYVVTYSIMYGMGFGISLSATSLALNTYFKEKRRRAASFAWTVTGIGPIVMPYMAIFLLYLYGIQGTVWIFSALALNALVSAMIYQPVKWHIRECHDFEVTPGDENFSPTENSNDMCRQPVVKRDNSIFSSQYLYAEDNSDYPGYEVLGHEVPMLSRANDGWYGSKLSLSSSHQSESRLRSNSFRNLKSKGLVNDELKDLNKGFLRPNNFNLQKHMLKSISNLNLNCDKSPGGEEKNDLLDKQSSSQNQLKTEDIEEEEDEVISSWLEKIVIFFDLDLLKDSTYVNLMLGITLSTFADMNFSVLTPFFLSDFGFNKDQIVLIMSLNGLTDLIVRFLIPFIAEHINWDNRVFFLIGISFMVIGRIWLTQIPSYSTTIVIFTFMGIGKGLRTIFMNLIIPSHVPLKRLPGASGLQLLTAGIFTLTCGPIIGIIRDSTNYSVTLNFLNIISIMTIVSWTLELVYQWCKRREKQEKVVTEII